MKQQDKRNEPAETALLKLAGGSSASDLGVGAEIAQAAAELAQRPDEGRLPVGVPHRGSGLLCTAGALDLRVYRPYAGRSFSAVFSPLPPGTVSHRLHHLRHRAQQQRRTRCGRTGWIASRAPMSPRESFQLPDDFDEQALLRYAWGVVAGRRRTGAGDPAVCARARRVLETAGIRRRSA